MKKNYKYLVKNLGLLSISQLGTKLIGFFLIPLYTNILTTEEYGTYDMFSTTISLIIPILTLNIMQSVMRFSLEKGSDKESILSSGIDVFMKGLFVFAALVLFNLQFELLPVINKYLFVFIMYYITAALQQMLTYFARGIDDVLAVSVGGFIDSIVMLVLNVVFLVSFHMGLNGYFYATILGLVASDLFIIIKTKIWLYIKPKKINKDLRKDMILYSAPLILNAIAWWINNASDRYVVIAICGVAANGIYSVAYKIPNILSMFQNIFNQAWTLSAVKDYDYNDSNGFFTKMYNTYNSMMVLICSALIIMDRIIARLLYAKDFYSAWKYAPFLLIAIVFGALSGYIGGIFSAVKDSRIYAQSTVVGAVINILLNLLLVYFFGPIGAAIATSVSYLMVWVIRFVKLRTYIKIRVPIIRDIAAYLLLFTQAAVLLLLCNELIIMYITEIAIFLTMMLFYRKELKAAVGLLLNKKLKKG